MSDAGPGTPNSPPAPRGRTREIASWCLYDFANSAYSAVIMSVVFGVYYAGTIVGNTDPDGTWTGAGDRWWGYVSSASMLFVAISSPFLGGVADSAGWSKRLWITYTWLAVLAVVSFSFLEQGMVLQGFALATIANIGIEGGIVFYNAYLPRIAPPEKQGRVSGWGFAVGYAGSLVALLLALPFTKPFHGTVIWLLVAAQIAVFSLPAFLAMPKDAVGSALPILTAAKRGAATSWGTLLQLLRDRDARLFFLAYLLYEDGVSTVIIFASPFAATSLGFEQMQLVVLFGVVQISALVGALAMAKPTDAIGPKFVVLSSLVLWCAVVVAARFVQSQGLFFGVACVAGLGLGTVQAASRAFYARFIPRGEENRYFGLYALVGKSAAILGPILFGQMSALYGQRTGILSVAVLFIGGLGLLLLVREPPARADAE